MVKKTGNKGLLYGLIAIGIVVVAYNLGLFSGFMGAVIPNELYNGDMEDWCIIPLGSTTTGYGWLNGGLTRCSASNSVPYLTGSYNGLSQMNEIPTMWGQKYGCCVQRSTDAYEGSYSALIHVQDPNDWYGFGMTRTGDKFFLPANPGRTYTLSYYYKYSRYAGRNPSMSLKFYDSSRNEIPGGRFASEYFPTTSWTQGLIVGDAPANAAYYGWDIWVPDDTDMDLYLDALVLEESDPCTPGATVACGIDTGMCSQGIRTCNDQGNWGVCTGAIVPSREACADNQDNDCDGVVDEQCAYVTPTLAQKVAAFDNLNTWHNGMGTIGSNDVVYWTWDNAPIVEAYVNMYMATGDTKYMDNFIANTDVLISKATDYDGDGLLDYLAITNPLDINLDYSHNFFPLVKFAYVVKQNKLVQYYNKADEYTAFVEQNIVPLWDQEWAECGELGFWKEGIGGTHSAPNNRVSFLGRTNLYLHYLTGQQVYMDKAIKNANKIKSTWELRTAPNGAEYYYWHYNDKAGCTVGIDGNYICTTICAADPETYCTGNPGSNWMCDGSLELWYGGYDLSLFMDYYEAGLYNEVDLTRMKNTLKEGFLINDISVGGVQTVGLQETGSISGPVDWKNAYYATAYGPTHWGRLAVYDEEIKLLLNEIWRYTYSVQQGNFYAEPYLCTIDTRDPQASQICGGDDDKRRTTPATSMITVSILAMDTNEPMAPIGGLCYPTWTCTEWSAFSVPEDSCGLRTRTCTDSNNCGTVYGRPVEQETVTCPDAFCGDGDVDDGESCDGDNLGGATCADANAYLTAGTLGCQPNCQFDIVDCSVGGGSNNEPVSCISDWDCTEWVLGANSTKVRTCEDLNDCDDPIATPATVVNYVPFNKAPVDNKILIVGIGLVIAYLIFGNKKKGGKKR